MSMIGIPIKNVIIPISPNGSVNGSSVPNILIPIIMDFKREKEKERKRKREKGKGKKKEERRKKKEERRKEESKRKRIVISIEMF